MGVPETVRQFYNATRTAVAELEANIRPSLQQYCDERQYGFSMRQKQLGSLSEKLETGRYERLSDMDDLLAATIVVPTVAHEPTVLEFLREILIPVQERLRNRTQKSPDVFRFDASRFVGRLRSQEGLEYSLGTTRLLCEIQIRTAFEHAWSVVTHDLVYKSDDRDWRKLRLAAQLKASVEQIELLIATFEPAAAALPVSAHPETDALSRIVDAFNRLVSDGLIPEELLPESWSRFADNVYDLVSSYERNRYARPAAVDALLQGLRASLESGELRPAISGSLFQLVLAEISSGRIRDASIANYRVVTSRELAEFYGVRAIPRPIETDWEF